MADSFMSNSENMANHEHEISHSLLKVSSTYSLPIHNQKMKTMRILYAWKWVQVFVDNIRYSNSFKTKRRQVQPATFGSFLLTSIFIAMYVFHNFINFTKSLHFEVRSSYCLKSNERILFSSYICFNCLVE